MWRPCARCSEKPTAARKAHTSEVARGADRLLSKGVLSIRPIKTTEVGHVGLLSFGSQVVLFVEMGAVGVARGSKNVTDCCRGGAGLGAGILALDEPTTNLDLANAKALAASLRGLMAARRTQARQLFSPTRPRRPFPGFAPLWRDGCFTLIRFLLSSFP